MMSNKELNKGEKISKALKKYWSDKPIEERRGRIRNAQIASIKICTGKKLSEEHKKKLREASKGSKNGMFDKCHTEESKIKMSEALKGRVISKEWKEKISKAGLGRKHSKEVRLKMSKAQEGNQNNLGHKHSKETIDKMKENHKGMKGCKHSEETKRKLRETSKIAKKKWWSQYSKEEKREKTKKWLMASLEANPSSIEKMIWEVLDSLGIEYETQVSFCYGRFIVDIYVRSKNLIIECNGNYWHNLPNRIKRDKFLQKYCDKWGIKLVWLWEKDIKKNPKLTLLKNVRKVIGVASTF